MNELLALEDAMDLEKELRELIDAKGGNRELALFFNPEADDWTLEIGNASEVVSLGEAPGEITVHGKDIPAVIAKAKTALHGNGRDAGHEGDQL